MSQCFRVTRLVLYTHTHTHIYIYIYIYIYWAGKPVYRRASLWGLVGPMCIILHATVGQNESVFDWKMCVFGQKSRNFPVFPGIEAPLQKRSQKGPKKQRRVCPHSEHFFDIFPIFSDVFFWRFFGYPLGGHFFDFGCQTDSQKDPLGGHFGDF